MLDEDGNPKLNEKGKKILRSSYSVLQDDFFNFMRAAGYTDVERGERGSTEEHLTLGAISDKMSVDVKTIRFCKGGAAERNRPSFIRMGT